MIRRIAVLMTVLTLTSAASALAATPDGGCVLVGGHAEAAPKGSEGQSADAPTVKDPTGVCETVASLRGGS